jgi:hypothetical protein
MLEENGCDFSNNAASPSVRRILVTLPLIRPEMAAAGTYNRRLDDATVHSREPFLSIHSKLESIWPDRFNLCVGRAGEG